MNYILRFVCAAVLAAPGLARAESHTETSSGAASMPAEAPAAEVPAAAMPKAEPAPKAVEAPPKAEKKAEPEAKKPMWPGKLQLNLTDDGKSWVRFLSWHQLWGRYTQMNPGTTVDGRALNDQLDAGIRRSRFILLSRFADRATMMFHVGINNQTFNNARKPQVYIHDVWADFDVVKKYFTVGTGLHYWNGVSRMSNWSTITFLALDAPIFNWPNIERTDQFARQLGVYFKGKIDKLDYRVAVNRPFQTGDPNLANFAEGVNYNPTNGSPSVQGYFMYQFWDQEANTVPYLTGTYIGKKRVFNLGTGFYYHPKQMRERRAGMEDELHDGLVVAGDVFLDMPLGEKAENGAITAYATYYYMDFGPDFVRNVGIMNLGDTGSGTTLNGAGNAFTILGTGHQVYAQVGYLVPMDLMGAKLQPFVTTQLSIFDGRDQAAVTPEVGANLFISGHQAKVTAMYRARPVFEIGDSGDSEVSTYRSEVIVQTQLFF